MSEALEESRAAWQQLDYEWQQVQGQWQDRTMTYFAAFYMEPLAAEVIQYLRATEEVADLLHEARQAVWMHND